MEENKIEETKEEMSEEFINTGGDSEFMGNNKFNIKFIVIILAIIAVVVFLVSLIIVSVVSSGKKKDSDIVSEESVNILSNNYSVTNTTELSLTGDLSITDINNISKLENLEKIEIKDYIFDDISFLSSLKKLSVVKISVSTKVTDFSVLGNLKNLFTLEIYGNIGTSADMNIFSNLDKISTMSLTFNSTRNVDFLKDMGGLSLLSIDCNKDMFNNISSMLENTKIKIVTHGSLSDIDLNLDDEVIPDGIINWSSYDVKTTEVITIDITPSYSDSLLLQSELNKLANYTKLKTLIIKTDENNTKPYSISNLNFLQDLVNLESLTLTYVNSNDMTALSYLTNLVNLDISYGNMAFSKFSSISNLTKLESLNLSMQNITNISFVSKLTNLKKLYLSGNNITDINPLKNLLMLNELYLGCNNNLSNFNPLNGLSNLQILMITPDEIDMSLFSNLKSLKTLYVGIGFQNVDEFKSAYKNISINVVSECV